MRVGDGLVDVGEVIEAQQAVEGEAAGAEMLDQLRDEDLRPGIPLDHAADAPAAGHQGRGVDAERRAAWKGSDDGERASFYAGAAEIELVALKEPGERPLPAGTHLVYAVSGDCSFRLEREEFVVPSSGTLKIELSAASRLALMSGLAVLGSIQLVG